MVSKGSNPFLATKMDTELLDKLYVGEVCILTELSSTFFSHLNGKLARITSIQAYGCPDLYSADALDNTHVGEPNCFHRCRFIRIGSTKVQRMLATIYKARRK